MILSDLIPHDLQGKKPLTTTSLRFTMKSESEQNYFFWIKFKVN